MVYKFDPVIYPIIFCIIFSEDLAKESELFVHTDGKLIYADTLDEVNATTSPVVIERDTDLYSVVLTIPKDNLSISDIAHEANHVARRIWEHIGEDESGEEASSYLIGWAAKCIDEAIIEYNKNKNA